MIKNIKRKKQMRLDELIKYVWDNELYPNEYESDFGGVAHFNDIGKFSTEGNHIGYFISPHSKFELEIEEPITEDTEFKKLITVSGHTLEILNSRHKTIKDVLENSFVKVNQIYAFIDGRLELIWEREEE